MSSAGKARQSSADFAPAAWLLPAALVFLPFFLFPLGILLRNSFYRDDPIELMVPDFTWRNYEAAFLDAFYRSVFSNTLILSLAVAALVTAIAYPFAYFMARYARRSIALIVWAVYMPLFVSVIVRSFGWMIVLSDSGLLNDLLLRLGLVEKPVKLLFEVEAMTIGMVHRYLPLAILPIFNALQKVPDDLFAASHNLGAGPLRAVRDVALPLSMPGVVISLQMVFAAALSDFVMPQLLGTTRFRLLAPSIFEEATVKLNLAMAAALSVSMMVVVCLLIAFSNHLLARAMPWTRPQ